MSIEPEGQGYKFLHPCGGTFYDGKFTPYAPPQDDDWGPWMTHPTPAEPDGQACGPGGFHMMKGLNATYAGSNWWLWDAQWSGLLGEDAEKCRVISVRLKRIQPEELWRRLREGTGRGANLKGAHLWGAHLEGANLKGANLWGANLEGANLKGANLKGANLWGAHLWGAHLEGANLKGAHLEGANLKGAHLEGANLKGAHLWGAHLWGANLEGAHLGNTDRAYAEREGATMGEEK